MLLFAAEGELVTGDAAEVVAVREELPLKELLLLLVPLPLVTAALELLLLVLLLLLLLLVEPGSGLRNPEASKLYPEDPQTDPDPES